MSQRKTRCCLRKWSSGVWAGSQAEALRPPQPVAVQFHVTPDPDLEGPSPSPSSQNAGRPPTILCLETSPLTHHTAGGHHELTRSPYCPCGSSGASWQRRAGLDDRIQRRVLAAQETAVHGAQSKSLLFSVHLLILMSQMNPKTSEAHNDRAWVCPGPW